METSLKPAFDNNNIPMVFSTDENFIPYLDVCFRSLVENSSENNNYDIVILYSSLSDRAKQRLSYHQKNNVSIRFVQMDEYMNAYSDLWYTHWGYSNAVYYRFFIPEIFSQYKKVLFLDGDIIVNCDIKELYDVDLGDNYIGAVKDLPRFLNDDYFIDYINDKLKIDRFEYFNAGILILNIEQISKMGNFLQICIDKMKELNKPLLQDQDVFNVIFNKKVKYLNYTYNMSWNLLHYHKNAQERMPKDVYDEYIKTWNNPKIVHYAGVYKPWKQPWLDYSDYFWKYARQSSFYEEIIYKNQSKGLGRGAIKNVVRRKRIYMQYLKCKFLRIFTFGRLKEHYCEKQERLKDQVRDYRRTLGK